MKDKDPQKAKKGSDETEAVTKRQKIAINRMWHQIQVIQKALNDVIEGMANFEEFQRLADSRIKHLERQERKRILKIRKVQ